MLQEPRGLVLTWLNFELGVGTEQKKKKKKRPYTEPPTGVKKSRICNSPLS
jgi:hypothetical protein